MFCVFHFACSASRHGSVSSEKKRPKSRTRSKSPFRSFRWPKKSKPEAAEGGSYSDDEDNIRKSVFGKTCNSDEGKREEQHLQVLVVVASCMT